jgi:hypothetical protein
MVAKSSSASASAELELKKTYETFVDSDSHDHDVEAGVKSNTKSNNNNDLYDAAAIRSEFRTYQSMLPKPDHLLQQQHSVDILHAMMESNNNQNSTISMPRFLQPESAGGIKPHNALCCLLLDDFHAGLAARQKRGLLEAFGDFVARWCIWALSAGRLHPQLHLPADVIRDQFYRVAHVIPTWEEAQLIGPKALRLTIRNCGLPIPNFLLDPEDPKQFPPHIALLVILQDGEQESRHLQNRLHRLAWLLFAFVALVLRLVLEVIGGAGAVWGGSEVFHLRKQTPTYDNNQLWRWISIAVGIFCFLRFVTLNAPQQEDEGDILGPAGPWSLRTPARLRAVCEHPFHYFCRAQAPSYSTDTKNRPNYKDK